MKNGDPKQPHTGERRHGVLPKNSCQKRTGAGRRTASAPCVCRRQPLRPVVCVGASGRPVGVVGRRWSAFAGRASGRSAVTATVVLVRYRRRSSLSSFAATVVVVRLSLFADVRPSSPSVCRRCLRRRPCVAGRPGSVAVRSSVVANVVVAIRRRRPVGDVRGRS